MRAAIPASCLALLALALVGCGQGGPTPVDPGGAPTSSDPPQRPEDAGGRAGSGEGDPLSGGEGAYALGIACTPGQVDLPATGGYATSSEAIQAQVPTAVLPGLDEHAVSVLAAALAESPDPSSTPAETTSTRDGYRVVARLAEGPQGVLVQQLRLECPPASPSAAR